MAQNKRKTIGKTKTKSKFEGAYHSNPQNTSLLWLPKNADCIKKERLKCKSQASISVDEGTKPSVHYPKEAPLFW